MNSKEPKSIIELLKQGDKATLEKVYIENREGFLNFAKKKHFDQYNSAI